MAHRSGDSHGSTDCFCPFGQQTWAACWTDFLSVSLSLRLFSAFVSACLLCHLPYSFAFPPSPPPPFPPFLGPAQRAEGRGQAGVSRAGRARRPVPPPGASITLGSTKEAPWPGGFQDPHCSSLARPLQVELPPALEEDKGMSPQRPEEHVGAEYSALLGALPTGDSRGGGWWGWDK